MRATPAADLDVADHGSVVVVTPRSTAAQLWVEEYVQTEQTWGQGFACEPRYVWPLVMAAMDAGLTWERC